MGHIPLTSVIREVNCLIVKDILLPILRVNSSVILTKVQNKGAYLNWTVVIQYIKTIFFAIKLQYSSAYKGICCSERCFRDIGAYFSIASVCTSDIQINVLRSKSQAVGPLLPLCSHKPFIPGLPIDNAARPWDEPTSSPLSSPLCQTIVCFCLPSSINLANPHYWADVPFSTAFLETVSFGMQIWGMGEAGRGFFSFFPSLCYNGPTLGLCSSREWLYWTLTESRARAWRQGQGDSA